MKIYRVGEAFALEDNAARTDCGRMKANGREGDRMIERDTDSYENEWE